MEKSVSANNEVFFRNNVDFCVGTGRMGLALQREYFEQLKLVQEKIGFKHIRGHGLFSDDMAIYHEYEIDGVKKVEFNFTYLDFVMDSYRELGLKPFLELGFMPGKLASGEQTIFYWKGNTTPPKDYSLWQKLITSTLQHLMERYGADEVVTWPMEVWNEPNLPGFWKGADMEEYFRLFEASFTAIKELDSRFKVGGPAICGVKDEFWIEEFMKFIDSKKIPVDFITRHHYTTGDHSFQGHYSYAKLEDANFRFNNLHSTRTIVDRFPAYKGLPIHITEYNTSYAPDNVIHDTNLNAAYLAHHLTRLGDDNESYSYWTFGDIFEEKGVPFTPFHGGFGMVANHCIPKPTFYTFEFYKKLKEGNSKCIYKDDDLILVKTEKGEIKGIAWNIQETRKPGEENLKELSVVVKDLEAGEYTLIKQIVDEETCNPLKLWHNLGEPSSLSKEQIELLQNAAKPLITSEIINSGDSELNFNLTVKENGVIYFECRKVKINSDRGYSYKRTCGLED